MRCGYVWKIQFAAISGQQVLNEGLMSESMSERNE